MKGQDIKRFKLSISHGFRCLSFCSAAILLIGGCTMIGPNYLKPTVQEPNEWIQKDDPKLNSESADLGQWWTVLNDPVMNALIEKAAEQNLTLQNAGIRILETRAQLGITIGDQFPQQQQAVGGYAYNRGSKNSANTQSADLTFSQLNIGFDATWELDIWGKFRRAVESSIGNFEASIASYDDILVSLSAEVARTYVLVRIAEERLAIAEENVKIQKRSLEIAQARFKGGAVTELDVQQAKALMTNTQASIPRLQSDLRQAKNALAILLGTLPGNIDAMLEGQGRIPTAPPEVAVGIPAELLRRRPDIKLAERRLAAQSARIGVAKADLYPHFSLFGSFGFVSTDSLRTKAGGAAGSDLGDLFQGDSFEFFGGPTVRWDILNYGRIRNQVRVEDARFQQLVIDYENTLLEASQEVEDAMVAFLKSQEEVRYLTESVAASKRSVDLSLIQYREGFVDYQRVLDTQRFLTDQQDLRTSIFGSVAINLIAMYKALGGGWESRIGKDFVPQETMNEMSKRTHWGDLLAPTTMESRPDEKADRKWYWPFW